MTRRRAAVDANQSTIVADLRAIGISVHSTHAAGSGFPDLVAGGQRQVCCPHCLNPFSMRLTELLEVKDGAKPPSARKLTPDQQQFISGWRGSPVRVVKSSHEALLVFQGDG